MKENLHGWVFTYNQYTDTYHATTRDNYFALFSSPSSCLSSSSFSVLEELIMRTNGEEDKIKQLFNGKV